MRNLPVSRARGFPGNRVDPYLAGITIATCAADTQNLVSGLVWYIRLPLKRKARPIKRKSRFHHPARSPRSVQKQKKPCGRGYGPHGLAEEETSITLGIRSSPGSGIFKEAAEKAHLGRLGGGGNETVISADQAALVISGREEVPTAWRRRKRISCMCRCRTSTSPTPRDASGGFPTISRPLAANTCPFHKLPSGQEPLFFRLISLLVNALLNATVVP